MSLRPRLNCFQVLLLFCSAFQARGLRAQQASAPAAYPPAMKHPLIPSHGSNLLGVFYLAGGSGAHPTAILFHGFPGFEQNLDLGQALRREGWNVLAMHYRGSWGVSGDFSFLHSAEDADAEVKFLLDPANAAAYHINTNRIIVIGHSMGGTMAFSAAAHNAAVRGAVLISAWNVGAAQSSEPDEAKALASNDNLAPIRGTDGIQLAHEKSTHSAQLDMERLAADFAPRPVLLVTSNDGSDQFAEPIGRALRSAGDKRVQTLHFDSDHAYSGKRQELIRAVLEFVPQIE